MAFAKGERITKEQRRNILKELKDLILTTLNNLSKKTESLWYCKIDDVAEAFANICSVTN